MNSRPITGAWIETKDYRVGFYSEKVAPSLGRGLKRIQGESLCAFHRVAPSLGRGLKPCSIQGLPIFTRSPHHWGVD